MRPALASLLRSVAARAHILTGALVDRLDAGARPDADGRLSGAARPVGVPDDLPAAAPLPTARATAASTLLGAAVALLRPRDGDVLVIRGLDDDARARVRADFAGEAGVAALRAMRLRAIVFLPRDCFVHVEGAAKPREELGYRETANLAVDAERDRHVCGAAPLPVAS